MKWEQYLINETATILIRYSKFLELSVIIMMWKTTENNSQVIMFKTKWPRPKDNQDYQYTMKS